MNATVIRPMNASASTGTPVGRMVRITDFGDEIDPLQREQLHAYGLSAAHAVEGAAADADDGAAVRARGAVSTRRRPPHLGRAGRAATRPLRALLCCVSSCLQERTPLQPQLTVAASR